MFKGTTFLFILVVCALMPLNQGQIACPLLCDCVGNTCTKCYSEFDGDLYQDNFPQCNCP